MRNKDCEVNGPRELRLMSVKATLNWLLFAAYVGLFFTFPLTLLWGPVGLWVGPGLSILFLTFLRFQGSRRIARRLKMKRLTRAEAPALFAIVQEYSRRLGITAPQLGIIETPALNSALFGFTRQDSHLVFTRGALDTLTREQLSALVCRQLTYLWIGDVYCDSWLSQFLAVIERIATRNRHHGTGAGRKFYSFRVLFRQTLLYPLTLFPALVLKMAKDPALIDLKAAKLGRNPHAFAEAYRRIEALQDRIPFETTFSLRHLFLLGPMTADPLARVFFGSDSLTPRISRLENLVHAAAKQ